MAKAKKMPSGKWRCQVYLSNPDGTKDRTSFTADTKAEAERMAREYQTNANRIRDNTGYTVQEAVDNYIKAKEKTLSPSTIYGYKVMARNCFTSIGNVKIKYLNNAAVQQFINSLDKSPKTVKNAYGLLTAAVTFYLPDRVFHVTLPKKVKRDATTPDDRQVKLLLDNAGDTLRKCIYLAAVGTLREGEISALKYKDICRDFSSVSVHADFVRNGDGEWVYKDYPKNEQSVRVAYYPKEIIEMLGNGNPEDYVIPWTPGTISKRFIELRNRLGLSCRFHDLRHYAASVRATIQPRVYTAADGGWLNSSNVLDDVYTDPLSDKKTEYRKKVNDYFVQNLL